MFIFSWVSFYATTTSLFRFILTNDPSFINHRDNLRCTKVLNTYGEKLTNW
nr:MAG TPA_asm: hypothetical protein [Caudoviricetes sp.]